jgi:L-fuculose-phosphate aldolase
MDKTLDQARELMCQAARIMFERKLFDLAGGNLSIRLDDRILITPSQASSLKFWQLDPEDILAVDLDGNILEGAGKVSTELVTHLTLLKTFYPVGTAIVHAHPRNVLVFCTTRLPIPPVLECTVQFGEIKTVAYASGGHQNEELAQNVLDGLLGQEERIAQYAAAVIAPWHGIFAVGKSLNAALDTVERIEVNARCILMSRLLEPNSDRLNDSHKALMNAIKEIGASYH